MADNNNRSSSQRIGIIGAGSAGLGAAYALVGFGRDVCVYDAGARVGGLASSLELWGHHVDLGPHLLQLADERVSLLWNRLFGTEEYTLFPRRTRIISRDGSFLYPYQSRDVIRNLGLASSVGIVADTALQRRRKGEAQSNLEATVIDRVGKRAYTRLFQPYVEKYFGVPASALESSFGDTLVATTHNFLRTAVASLFAGRSVQKENVNASLVWPQRGTGQFLDRLAEDIVARGGKIALQQRVNRVIFDDQSGVILSFANGTEERFDAVVSTIPLPLLLRSLDDVPASLLQANDLQTRAVVLVYLRVMPAPDWHEQWLFIMPKEFAVCRVTNYANFRSDSEQSSEAVLSAEFWCDKNDPTWNATDKSLTDLAHKEILALGLLPEAHEVRDTYLIRIPRAFPVPLLGSDAVLQEVGAFLAQHPRLKTIGRLGAFGNEGVLSSLSMGLKAANELVADNIV